MQAETKSCKTWMMFYNCLPCTHMLPPCLEGLEELRLEENKSLRDIMSDTVCMTNPLSTSSGCSSPLGSPSGVKCLSSSLASSSVELPLWLSLGPIRLSEELLLNSLQLWMTHKFIHATNHKLTIPTIEQMHKLISHLIHCFEIH